MKRAVPLFFYLCGSLLLVFGLGALGAGLYLRPGSLPDGFAWIPPLEQIDSSALGPATVLLPLTGVSGADALNAALDQGDWENAYAVIAYDPELPEPTRIGGLLQLGSRYADAKRNLRAAWCYLYAARIATTSPILTDRLREDTFLQVAAGLRAIDAREAARLAVDQAYLIAQYSVVLRREPTLRRYVQIADAYAELGVENLANQARAKSNELVTFSAEDEAVLPREPFVIVSGVLPPSPEIDQAAQVRMAAARQLQQDLQDNPPRRSQDWPQDSVAQLKQALLEEDRLRLQYYERELAASPAPDVRVALLRDRVKWLAIKYRVAHGDMAAPLVQQWQKDAAAIRNAWSDAWADLFKWYESQAAAIPNSQAVSQATEDVLREELSAIRWGWYRGGSEDELHATLADLSRQMRAAKILSLRVDVLTVGNKSTDLLVPDELYGKNEQALPK